MRVPQWALIALLAPVLADSAAAGPTAPTSQAMADELAHRYRSSGRIRKYAVDIEVKDGIVDLTGVVGDQQDWQELLNLTTSYPGVRHVNESVKILDSPVRLADARDAAPRPLPMSTRTPHTNVSYPSAGMAEPVLEPRPVTSFAGGIAPYADAPVLPPYSWPAYTPYNNYASMCYQTQYPSGAWPFIGPPHPYPMIPSGWRRVELKWKRGYWWMHFKAH